MLKLLSDQVFVHRRHPRRRRHRHHSEDEEHEVHEVCLPFFNCCFQLFQKRANLQVMCISHNTYVKFLSGWPGENHAFNSYFDISWNICANVANGPGSTIQFYHIRVRMFVLVLVFLCLVLNFNHLGPKVWLWNRLKSEFSLLLGPIAFTESHQNIKFHIMYRYLLIVVVENFGLHILLHLIALTHRIMFWCLPCVIVEWF